jgi:hypothetical protein
VTDDVPDDLAELDHELDRRAQRRIEPGRSALTVTICMFVLIVALMLPWTGYVAGWEVLTGVRPLGFLPRLFSFTSLGFGLVGSTLALATRWWALAWLCTVGCGFSVVNGVWAIWSRQVGVPAGGTAAGIGMVLAALAMLVLAATWARIAITRT